jgi:hypothetical protein
VSTGANLELDLHIQLKDAENLKMTASRMLDSKSDWQKVKLKLKQRLKLPGGEEKTVPAEDGHLSTIIRSRPVNATSEVASRTRGPILIKWRR